MQVNKINMEFPYRQKSRPLEQIGISKKVRELIATMWNKFTQETSKKSVLLRIINAFIPKFKMSKKRMTILTTTHIMAN